MASVVIFAPMTKLKLSLHARELPAVSGLRVKFLDFNIPIAQVARGA